MKEQITTYRWLPFVVYSVIAWSAVHIGNDNPFFVLISLPSYRTDLALSLICTFGTGWYLHRLHRRPQPSLQYTVFYGIVLPVGVVATSLILYLEYYLGLPLLESSFFYLELPLISLFCVMINLFYLRLQNYSRTNQEELVSNTPGPSLSEKVGRNHIVVHTGKKSTNLPLSAVAYFIIQDKFTFLVTRNGDRFLYDRPLAEVAKEVSSADFFPLNRQVIAHRQSVLSFTRTATRKLEIELLNGPKTPIYVSKIKAPKFLNWLHRGSLSA